VGPSGILVHTILADDEHSTALVVATGAHDGRITEIRDVHVFHQPRPYQESEADRSAPDLYRATAWRPVICPSRGRATSTTAGLERQPVADPDRHGELHCLVPSSLRDRRRVG